MGGVTFTIGKIYGGSFLTNYDECKRQPFGTISRDYTGIHLWCNLVQDQKYIILLLRGNNWDIVLHGHISWRAHVNIIDWRSLECQICS